MTKLLFKTLCIVLASTFVAIAQENQTKAEDILRPNGPTPGFSGRQKMKFYLGLDLHGSYNIFSQTISGLHTTSPLRFFEKASGLAYGMNLVAGYNLTDNFAFQIDAGGRWLRLGYGTGTGNTDCLVVGSSFPPIISSSSVTMTQADYLQIAQINISGKYQLNNNIFLLAGYTAELWNVDVRTVSEGTLPANENCTWSRNGQKYLMIDTTIKLTNNVAYHGASVAVGYKYPISKHFDFRAQAGFTYMLTPVLKDRTEIDNTQQYTRQIDTINLSNSKLHNSFIRTGIYFNF